MSEMKSTRDGYGEGLRLAGELYENVVAIDADVQNSTKSQNFQDKFPNRFFNVGISEQDLVCTAAGLSSCGKIAFASTFAVFLEKGFEQIRNSIARSSMNVKLCGSHAGIHTGEDGTSAQAIVDIAVMRSLPNMVVLAPMDFMETKKAVIEMAKYLGPVYIRTARNNSPSIYDDTYDFKIGKGSVLREGNDATIIAIGHLVTEALAAQEVLKSENINVRVINMSTIKPIDKELVVASAKETGAIVTAEDHSIIGGLGSAVAEVLSEERPTILKRIGVKDTFGESGKPAELYEKYGLTANHIVVAVKEVISKK